MSVYEKLLNIQTELKAPKSQYNSFGKYSYRNCEDILEAVKPLLIKQKATLTISDEILLVGNRFYIKSTVTFIDIETSETISNTSYAREEENKKGMDGSQITGASSSYARKYALNGMFAIDDTKDSDTTNTHDKEQKTQAKVYLCKQCGNQIKGYKKKDGTQVTAEKLSNSTGVCIDCYKKSKQEAEQ